MASENLPDKAIDTGEIPENPVEQLRFAERGNRCRPVKQSITIRLDADVLTWFKAHAAGSGYQTEINAVCAATLPARTISRFEPP